MPHRHSDLLEQLLAELYDPDQLSVVRGLQQDGFSTLVEFDFSLGGPSLSTMNRRHNGGLTCRAEIADRDVFRPLQYCLMYFRHWDDLDWFARDIVETSCAHVEALVKRIGRSPLSPLGRAIREAKVRRTLDPVLHEQVNRFVPVYNDSKHSFNQPVDTHMFSVPDAFAAYFVARALGLRLYPVTPLATDLAVFTEPIDL